jgi:hypothetical protein
VKIRTFVLSTLVVIALGAGSSAAEPSQQPVDVDAVLAYLGFDAKAKRDLLAGEIISTRIPESKEETELAIAIAMFARTTPGAIYAGVAAGETLRADREILELHEITSWPPAEADFAGVQLGADESGEVAKLLRVEGGSEFNLSSEEIERFRALRSEFSGKGVEKDPAVRRAVSAALQGVLLERYRAYREKGLAGIAAYDRGGKKRVDPAEKLRLAGNAAKFFRRHEPELYRAFVDFPKIDPAEAEHRFYWIKQRVQDRPTLVLSHRMLTKQPTYVASAERMYYVGHSYNSVQIIAAALPVEEGLVAFYSNRTSIDQLAGFGGKVARPIAAPRLIERVTKRFETVRAGWK